MPCSLEALNADMEQLMCFHCVYGMVSLGLGIIYLLSNFVQLLCSNGASTQHVDWALCHLPGLYRASKSRLWSIYWACNQAW